MTETDHQARMERLKSSVDRRIAAAQDEKGLLVVHTGAGKGNVARSARPVQSRGRSQVGN